MSQNRLDFFNNVENESFLTSQIITYLGNKRSLLTFIGNAVNIVKEDLCKDKLDILDMFSGSGIVSRFFKQYANTLYSNDLEGYCFTLNNCYLSNKNDINTLKIEKYYKNIKEKLQSQPLKRGFISKLYAPYNDNDIKINERVFFTSRNAMYIDTARQFIEEVPSEYKCFLLAPLIYEASVHNNTSGVFKGFYKNTSTGIGQFGGNGKNALSRIMSDIKLQMPIFSNFNCKVKVYQKDANILAEEIEQVDLVYIDPPYNQHPYGSNYFMLNLINDYKEPKEISNVSGIPKEWNKSNYNKKKYAKDLMFDLCKKLNTKYLLISFSSDGFIKKEEMTEMLSKLGELTVLDKDYNTFRGSRNLNKRDIYVKEFLYLLKKK